MNRVKPKRSKPRPGFRRVDWHERVDPAFRTYWSVMKKNRALSKINDKEEVDRPLDRWTKEFSAASQALDEARGRIENPVADTIQSAVLKPLDMEGPNRIPPFASKGQEDAISYPQNAEASAIFRKLVFLKYGITFRELIHQVDIAKDPRAHRQLMAVHRDYWRMKTGIRLQNLRLKFGLDHFEIITQGFDFGLRKLSPDELAECLDEICPCDQRHSTEYIKKLRTRIANACDQLIFADH